LLAVALPVVEVAAVAAEVMVAALPPVDAVVQLDSPAVVVGLVLLPAAYPVVEVAAVAADVEVAAAALPAADVVYLDSPVVAVAAGLVFLAVVFPALPVAAVA